MNLAKNAGSKVKKVNEVGKDLICRMIFLNLVVDEQKVVPYQMTKSFSKLEKAHSVLNWSRYKYFERTYHSIIRTTVEVP